MAPTRSHGGSAGLATLHRFRWWVATVVSVVAVGVLLALDVDAFIQVLVVALALLLWGPVIAAWSRGLWRSAQAFREGLDGR